MSGLEGTVVLITGASSGIGQACAVVFARAKAVLWVASRPPHVDVKEMVILPTAQASATLAHREP